MSLVNKKLISENPISVSEYIEFLNEVLKNIKARVIGEVSELQIAASGHVYFTLKDKEDGGVLRCVIWRSTYRMCGVSLTEGMEIIISGVADIYAPRGSLAFKAETIELVGEGALKKAYEVLKLKLSQEGLFDEERKRPLPKYPKNIGVITSLKSGTVIHDFTSNLGKYGFKIMAMDSRVEGQEAIKDLLASIKSFRKKDIDVLVIIRGGGSLESLLAFDNEMLVREIAHFPVPVIAGIGHHKDITLAALVSDASGSTPTAAAHLLNYSWEQLLFRIEKEQRDIIANYQKALLGAENTLDESSILIKENFNKILNYSKELENTLKNNLNKLKYSFLAYKKKNIEQIKNITKSFKQAILLNKDKIINLEKTILHNDPQRQLKLGYSIARLDGKIIRSINQVKTGSLINLEVKDGTINSEVKKIIK